GFNTIDYSHAGSGLTVDLADQIHNTGAAAGDSYTNIQGIIGSAFNDTLIGDDGDNILRGRGGVDTMSGGDGDDRYVVDNPDDVVNELVGRGIDKIITKVDYTLAHGSEVEGLRAHSDQGLILNGNEVNNFIVGGAGNDTLSGGGG